MQKIIDNIDNGLAKLENIIIIVLISVMVVMAFFQVVLRNLFATGLLWGDIFLRHLVLWVGFIGASLATRESKHINIDILSRFLSTSKLPFLRLAIDLITATVCFILARAGYIFIKFEIEAGTTLFKDIPAWIFQIIIPIGFALIGFRFVLKAAEQILSINKSRKSDTGKKKKE
jgi:TRAP-type C4-dicarboxylate transport system permease small subunit